MIKTIIFDVGGVLIASLNKQAAIERRELLAKRIGYADGVAMWNYFFDGEPWQAARTGQIVSAEMWRRLLVPHGIDALADRNRFLAELFEFEGVLPGMKPLLHKLAAHYQLGILSNADDLLEKRLHELYPDELPLFDAVIKSHHIGLAKPDPKAYEVTLEKLQAVPEQTLFIDDLVRNTSAAEQMGIHTHIFTGMDGLYQTLHQVTENGQAAS